MPCVGTKHYNTKMNKTQSCSQKNCQLNTEERHELKKSKETKQMQKK